METNLYIGELFNNNNFSQSFGIIKNLSFIMLKKYWYPSHSFDEQVNKLSSKDNEFMKLLDGSIKDDNSQPLFV